jgi:hypothetical protein
MDFELRRLSEEASMRMILGILIWFSAFQSVFAQSPTTEEVNRAYVIKSQSIRHYIRSLNQRIAQNSFRSAYLNLHSNEPASALVTRLHEAQNAFRQQVLRQDPELTLRRAIEISVIDTILSRRTSDMLTTLNRNGITIPSAMPPKTSRLIHDENTRGVLLDRMLSLSKQMEEAKERHQTSPSDTDGRSIAVHAIQLKLLAQLLVDANALIEHNIKQPLSEISTATAVVLESARFAGVSESVTGWVRSTLRHILGEKQYASDVALYIRQANATLEPDVKLAVAQRILGHDAILQEIRYGKGYKLAPNTIELDPALTYLQATPDKSTEMARVNNVEHLDVLRKTLGLIGSQMISIEDGKIIALRKVGNGDSARFQFVSVQTGGFGERDRYDFLTAEFLQSQLEGIVQSLKTNLQTRSKNFRPLSISPMFNLTAKELRDNVSGQSSSAKITAAVVVDVLTLPIQPVLWSFDVAIGKIRARTAAHRADFISNEEVVLTSKSVAGEMQSLLTSSSVGAGGGICKRLITN